MKKHNNRFELRRRGRKTFEIGKKYFLSAGIFFLTSIQALSQSQITMTRNEILNYSVGGGLVVIFLFLLFLGIRKAILVMNENGKSVQFTFPIFRGMAQNTKTVAILFFIVILSAIFWALAFAS